MTMSRRQLVKDLSWFAFGAGLGIADQASAEDFTMKLTTTASNDLDTEWLALLKQGVEAASGGRIKANVYPASQLGSTETVIEGVAMGTVEVTVNASGLYEGLDSRFAALAVPGIISSVGHGAKVLADPDVRRRLGTIARDKGVEVITVLASSPVGIVSHQPITSFADFGGMKIRIPGSAVVIEQLQQLGASPIAMSPGEVLPAFQNGTLDGVYAGTTLFSALKYYDISKNLTLLPATFLVLVGLVSSDFLTSLGSLQTIFRDQAHEADVVAAAWGETDAANARANWEMNGGKILTLPSADAGRYLDIVVPIALRSLGTEARADYEILKAASTKYA